MPSGYESRKSLGIITNLAGLPVDLEGSAAIFTIVAIRRVANIDLKLVGRLAIGAIDPAGAGHPALFRKDELFE